MWQCETDHVVVVVICLFLFLFFSLVMFVCYCFGGCFVFCFVLFFIINRSDIYRFSNMITFKLCLVIINEKQKKVSKLVFDQMINLNKSYLIFSTIHEKVTDQVVILYLLWYQFSSQVLSYILGALDHDNKPCVILLDHISMHASRDCICVVMRKYK